MFVGDVQGGKVVLTAVASPVLQITVQMPLIAAVWVIIVKPAGMALLLVPVDSACVQGPWMIAGQQAVWTRRSVLLIVGPVPMTVEKTAEPVVIQWRLAMAVAVAVLAILQIQICRIAVMAKVVSVLGVQI